MLFSLNEAEVKRPYWLMSVLLFWTRRRSAWIPIPSQPLSISILRGKRDRKTNVYTTVSRMAITEAKDNAKPATYQIIHTWLYHRHVTLCDVFDDVIPSFLELENLAGMESQTNSHRPTVIISTEEPMQPTMDFCLHSHLQFLYLYTA